VYQLLFAPLKNRGVGSRALLGLPRCRSVRNALPSFLAVTLLGFNASSCSSDRLTKVCRASVKCLSRVRAGRLAFAAAAASQRQSPRRPAAVFTPSVPVLGHWELARSATSRARSLLGCDLALTAPSGFEAMPFTDALRCRPETLQAFRVPPRWRAAGPGATVGASDGSLRPPPENHKKTHSIDLMRLGRGRVAELPPKLSPFSNGRTELCALNWGWLRLLRA